VKHLRFDLRHRQPHARLRPRRLREERRGREQHSGGAANLNSEL
jgi:hypothetical protein